MRAALGPGLVLLDDPRKIRRQVLPPLSRTLKPNITASAYAFGKISDLGKHRVIRTNELALSSVRYWYFLVGVESLIPGPGGHRPWSKGITACGMENLGTRGGDKPCVVHILSRPAI